VKKYLIFVEGKADVVFLRDFLLFHRNGLEAKIKKRNKYIDCYLSGENIEVKIVEGGGYTKVEKAKTFLETHLNDRFKILIIQDADNPEKDPNNGGKELRLRYLEKIKKELKIDFETFLFPNNENDGDLETLLLKIVNKEQFTKSFDCYKKYADCSKLIAPIEHSNELLEDKNVVFNYFRTYYGMDNAKEEKRIFTDEYWRFSSRKLEPLKLFLSNLIK